MICFICQKSNDDEIGWEVISDKNNNRIFGICFDCKQKIILNYIATEISKIVTGECYGKRTTV